MYARKPEVASGTSVPEARRTTQSRALQGFFVRVNRGVLHLSVADDHVGLAGEDRLDEPEMRRVLVVGVRVDDDVGSELGDASIPAGRRARDPGWR